MFFSLVPNISYDEKPIRYPFSESDVVTAKNFFRRCKINDNIFSYAVVFNKYILRDVDKPDTLAYELYGDQYYDWVILLTNNIINPMYDWPLPNYALIKAVEKEYDDPYATIHHYETYAYGPYPAGLRVDETFYNTTHKLNLNGIVTVKNGNELCKPVTVMDYFFAENEKKREIYLLKPRYLEAFVTDFRKQNTYKNSNNYISERLKKTG